MKLVTLLFRNERIFVEDAVEDKKTRAVIGCITIQTTDNENFFESYSFNEEETHTPVEEQIQEEPTPISNEDPFLDMDSIDLANSNHLEEINESEENNDNSLDTIDIDSDLELDE